MAFSGEVQDGDAEFTEPKLNVRADGSHISEAQTKAEFHENFQILIVAEKYQMGFDEPLLHTIIVDKKLQAMAKTSDPLIFMESIFLQVFNPSAQVCKSSVRHLRLAKLPFAATARLNVASPVR